MKYAAIVVMVVKRFKKTFRFPKNGTKGVVSSFVRTIPDTDGRVNNYSGRDQSVERIYVRDRSAHVNNDKTVDRRARSTECFRFRRD